MITRPFKVIFFCVCRTTNFYTAKKDGIINQEFSCGKKEDGKVGITNLCIREWYVRKRAKSCCVMQEKEEKMNPFENENMFLFCRRQHQSEGMSRDGRMDE